MFSLVHSFVAGSLVTNTQHEASRLLLRRMVQFFHLTLVTDHPGHPNETLGEWERIEHFN